MLRYYSYYSVGGYKDFYLGSNADQFDASYYLSLLPVWEKRAQEKEDAELQKEVAINQSNGRKTELWNAQGRKFFVFTWWLQTNL